MNASSVEIAQEGDGVARAVSLALADEPLDDAAVAAVTGCAPADLPRLFAGARAVRRKNFGNALELCAIVNAKCGGCSEDCAFCAQSSRSLATGGHHAFLEPEEIGRAAAAMKARGASRFGIVASGLAPTEADFEKLLRAVALVRATGLAADVSVGNLSAERLKRLGAAGLTGVHHNLEVGRSFFPHICTSHDYEEDVETVRLALAAGFKVCSGCIFGVGEGWEHRAELARTLGELGVHSVPMNFLMPIPGTLMEHRPTLAADEAMQILALFRLMLPRAHLRICGGRELVFGEPGGEGQRRLFDACADGVMIGDFLTVAGTAPEADVRLARALGLSVIEADPG